MNDLRRIVPSLAAVTFLLLAGCAGKAPLRVPPVASPEEKDRSALEAHLLGTWENSGKSGKTKQMIFSAGGAVQFQGGLEYFNPGRWEVDPGRHELILTMPQADDEKLQIFKLYVGDGVKAFDRAHERVTYAFDEQTWSLNVGGWPYTKLDTSGGGTQALPEPVIQ
jgi:predicted small lipoprotein YifL